MNDEMSLDDAVKVLNDNWHRDSRWQAKDGGAESGPNRLSRFEAVATAREWLRRNAELDAARRDRPVAGPVARSILVDLAATFRRCFHRGFEVAELTYDRNAMRAFLAEVEADE